MTVNIKKDATWFIDMGGTIAEWKVGCEGQLRMPGYFRALGPTSFLPPLREFAASGGRVYILSSYLTGYQALRDKQEWVDEHFPEVPEENRLFVPCGIGKTDFVKGWFGLDRLTDRMVLFDDLSANLHEWKAAGGKGVKCYNGINGTWHWDGVMWSSDLRATLWMPAA